MEAVLTKLLEHNHWANDRLIEACCGLSDEQLAARDAPDKWSVRQILIHIVEVQQDYLAILKRVKARQPPEVAFDDLRRAASESGNELLALADAGIPRDEIRDQGYRFEPWVVMVQVLNHATDHRRQIAGLLRSVGVTPPRLDGWAYGEATGALTRPGSDTLDLES